MKTRLLILGLLLGNYCLSWGQTNIQDQADAWWAEAQKAYQEERYTEAIEQYQKISQSGMADEALYFNLANAYYKSNQVGNSIYYYEKALLLNPEDEDVAANLAYAQKMTLDQAATPLAPTLGATMVRSIVHWNPKYLKYGAWLGMWLFVAFVVLYRLGGTTRVKKWGFALATLSLMTGLMCFSAEYLRDYWTSKDQPAIVFGVVSIREAPAVSAPELFTLNEGTKVQVLEELEGWGHIALADGTQGWMELSGLKKLRELPE